MIPTFSHNVSNSFFLWLDNYLATKLQAHKTYETKFYYYNDARLGNNKVVYGSPYKQFVYDNSVPDATIPSGLTIDGTFIPTGTSGMMFDFDNGRVIFDNGVSTGLNITGTYISYWETSDGGWKTSIQTAKKLHLSFSSGTRGKGRPSIPKSSC